MAIEIRTATMDDYEAICSLFSELDAYHVGVDPETFQASDGLPRPLERVKAFLDEEDKAFYVAAYEGVIVGFLNCELADSPDLPMFRPRRFVKVQSVFVTREQRRQGIARRLIEEAKRWARSKEADKLELSVYAANQPAVEAYRRLGFRDLKQTMEVDL
jgi:ribosomal protein S18 acetylase RimI-like enzyme